MLGRWDRNLGLAGAASGEAGSLQVCEWGCAEIHLGDPLQLANPSPSLQDEAWGCRSCSSLGPRSKAGWLLPSQAAADVEGGAAAAGTELGGS